MKHTNEELIEIYSKLKGDAIYSEYFIKNYEISYGEFDEDEDWEDITESVEAHTLNYCLKDYLPYFLKCIQNGHGPVWADKFAYNMNEDEVATLTYQEIMGENPELARSEINIYCNSLSKDDIFKNYYLFLIEKQCFRKTEERTIEYVKTYKDQIVKGKSEFYAHQYADLRVSSMGYTELYCEAYTATFEKALNENKSIDYAESYAEKLGTYIANHCSSFSNKDEFGDFDFFHEQILEEMREWELKNNNILTLGYDRK